MFQREAGIVVGGAVKATIGSVGGGIIGQFCWPISAPG